MNDAEIELLLSLHRRAYGLLIHLDQRTARDPGALAPDVVKTLSHHDTCARWIASRRGKIPAEYLPERQHEQAFAHMFSSFFDTSFGVECTEHDGAVLDARLHKGRQCDRGDWRSVTAVCALAIKHVLAAEGLRITEPEAKRLAGRRDIHEDVRVLAYVYELGRRAKGKSKGPVDHRLWRSVPLETRKLLDVVRVGQAKTRIMMAARAVQAITE